MSKRFYEIEIGQRFRLVAGGTTNTIYTKINKSFAHSEGSWMNRPINSQASVVLVEEEFTAEDRDLIEEIVERAIAVYGSRVKEDRLRKALYAAHRAKPIRLNDLLETCYTDFFYDVFDGAYRRYDETTDTMKDGWTAQHAEPHIKAWWE